MNRLTTLKTPRKTTWIKLIAVGLALTFVFTLLGGSGTAEAAGLKGDGVSIVKIIREALATAITSQTSLTTQQIKDQLKQGKSLADIITGAGGSVDKVEAAAKDSIKKQLDSLVDSGKLTRTHADRLFSRIDKHLDRLVNHTPGARGTKLNGKTKGSATPAPTPAATQSTVQ